MNDSRVTAVPLHKVLSCQAYILLYSRIPPPSSSGGSAQLKEKGPISSFTEPTSTKQIEKLPAAISTKNELDDPKLENCVKEEMKPPGKVVRPAISLRKIRLLFIAPLR